MTWTFASDIVRRWPSSAVWLLSPMSRTQPLHFESVQTGSEALTFQLFGGEIAAFLSVSLMWVSVMTSRCCPMTHFSYTILTGLTEAKHVDAH